MGAESNYVVSNLTDAFLEKAKNLKRVSIHFANHYPGEYIESHRALHPLVWTVSLGPAYCCYSDDVSGSPKPLKIATSLTLTSLEFRASDLSKMLEFPIGTKHLKMTCCKLLSEKELRKTLPRDLITLVLVEPVYVNNDTDMTESWPPNVEYLEWSSRRITPTRLPKTLKKATFPCLEYIPNTRTECNWPSNMIELRAPKLHASIYSLCVFGEALIVLAIGSVKTSQLHQNVETLDVYLNLQIDHKFPRSLKHLILRKHGKNLIVEEKRCPFSIAELCRKMLPETLNNIETLYLFDYDGPNLAHIPPNVKNVILGNSYNGSLRDLPDTVKELTLGDGFNQPLDDMPRKNLTHLILGDSFNRNIGSLPRTLIHLSLGNAFNRELKKLPQLCWLCLGKSFSGSLANLPSSIVHLMIHRDSTVDTSTIDISRSDPRFTICYYCEEIDTEYIEDRTF